MIVIGLLFTSTRAVGAQTVDAAQLQTLCHQVGTEADNARAPGVAAQDITNANAAAAALKDLCALSAPTDPAWSSFLFPTVDQLKQHAAALAKLTGGKAVITGALAGTIGDLAAIPAGFETNLILGTEQFVVDRVSRELNDAIVHRYATVLCTKTIPYAGPTLVLNGKSWKLPDGQLAPGRFVSETCELLRGADPGRVDVALPSWSIVRASLRHDLLALPDTFRVQLRGYAATAIAIELNTDRQTALVLADRIAGMEALIGFASNFRKQRDFSQAFGQAITAMDAWDATLTLQPTDWRWMPVAARLRAGALLGRTGGALAAKAFGAGNIEADTVVLYSLKALAINLLGNKPNCQDALATGDAQLLSSHFSRTGCAAGRSVPFDALKMYTVADTVGTHVFAGARDLLALKDATAKDRLDATLAVVSDVLPAVAYVAPADWPQVNYAAFNRLVVVARKYVDIIGSKERQQLPELVVDVTTLATAIGDAGFQHVVLPERAVAAIDFAANVATATDANGVQAALEHAAAPTDAYTRKRVHVPGESWGYVTLNAYGGGTVGHETATSPALASRVGAAQAGLYMPLGVEVGRKELWRPRAMHPGFSAGIFAQLIDLGQVATWRLTAKDSAVKSDPPAFKLQNVFSPGVFGVVHVPGFPLTIGGGRSWAPRFRELTLTTPASGAAATPARADVWRTSAFLAVDVTIR